MTRARYTVVAQRPDVLAIADLCEPGTMSVTNDIEAVAAELVALRLLTRARSRLIYRDTDGVWDQVALDAQLRPIAFDPIRSRSLPTALTAARRPPRLALRMSLDEVVKK